jgi:hypothetical protein
MIFQLLIEEIEISVPSQNISTSTARISSARSYEPPNYFHFIIPYHIDSYVLSSSVLLTPAIVRLISRVSVKPYNFLNMNSKRSTAAVDFVLLVRSYPLIRIPTEKFKVPVCGMVSFLNNAIIPLLSVIMLQNSGVLVLYWSFFLTFLPIKISLLCFLPEILDLIVFLIFETVGRNSIACLSNYSPLITITVIIRYSSVLPFKSAIRLFLFCCPRQFSNLFI